MNESGGYFCGLCCKKSLGEFGNLIRVRQSFWRKAVSQINDKAGAAEDPRARIPDTKRPSKVAL
jgi:hypothetical protein